MDPCQKILKLSRRSRRGRREPVRWVCAHILRLTKPKTNTHTHKHTHIHIHTHTHSLSLSLSHSLSLSLTLLTITIGIRIFASFYYFTSIFCGTGFSLVWFLFIIFPQKSVRVVVVLLIREYVESHMGLKKILIVKSFKMIQKGNEMLFSFRPAMFLAVIFLRTFKKICETAKHGRSTL